MSDITANSAGALNADPSARYYVHEHHPENSTLLGFWLYLMSDCLIFACLFATYAVSVSYTHLTLPTNREV